MKSTIRKIWDAATAVLVCLVVAFAGLLVGPKLFGLDVYIVLSGSMEPDSPTGSVIYVQETDVESLDYWDVITFQQASPKSGDFSTYEPFLTELSAYVKKYAPGAKQYIHAIWAWSDARLSLKAEALYKNVV